MFFKSDFYNRKRRTSLEWIIIIISILLYFGHKKKKAWRSTFSSSFTQSKTISFSKYPLGRYILSSIKINYILYKVWKSLLFFSTHVAIHKVLCNCYLLDTIKRGRRMYSIEKWWYLHVYMLSKNVNMYVMQWQTHKLTSPSHTLIMRL